MSAEIQFVQDYYWPTRIKTACFANSFHYVKHADFAISLARPGGVAVQAGGNIGLWPLRMAASGKFKQVVTFEPEPMLFMCLLENTRRDKRVSPLCSALGEKLHRADIRKRSLAAHRIVEGEKVQVVPLDDANLKDVTLIQLDIEGYELRALNGAFHTINRWRPVIQVELGGLGIKNGYGDSDADVRAFMKEQGYREVRKIGHDVVFSHA